MDKSYITSGGSAAATERIQSELSEIRKLSTEEAGFTTEPVGKDLYHWHVKLFGFGNDTPLGQGLTEWALRYTQISDKTSSLDQDILLEMKFPSDYPQSTPIFRIIRPRFHNVDVDVKISSEQEEKVENKEVNPLSGKQNKQTIKFDFLL